MSYDEKIDIEFDHGQSPVSRATSNTTTAAPADPEGERRVRQLIEHHASKNAELLNEIMSTHDAVHAVQNNEARLKRLKDELTAQQKAVREASEATETLRAKYTKSRDSFTRRWIYILTNMRQNLQRKVEESETAYNEALAAQSEAEQREQRLKEDKETVEKENASVAKDAKRHGAAHGELDRLYSEIFDGLTPGFPDEDEQEANYRKQKDEHNATTKTLMEITAASKKSGLLKSTIARALKENSRARYELQTSLFSGTEYALIYLDRCARLIDQAIGVGRQVAEELSEPLEEDFEKLHQKLGQHLLNAHAAAVGVLSQSYYASSNQVFRAIQDVSDEGTLAGESQAEMNRMINTYGNTANQAVKITSRVLEDARQALQEIRQNLFEMVVGHGAAAPPYHECCDRAEGFENDANAQCERMPDPIIDDSGLPPPPSYENAVSEG